MATKHSLTPRLSSFEAWALALGGIIGWGAFVMPGTTFLPTAGPLGTAIAFGIAAVVMSVIALNIHYMMNRYPVTGGAFVFAHRMFGRTHGYICGWFLILAYLTIIPLNATALALISRNLMGNLLSFGPSYNLAGYDTYLVELILGAAMLVVATLVAIRSTKAMGVLQAVLVCCLVVGVGIIAISVWSSPIASPENLQPGYSPDFSPLMGIVGVLAVAPWAFVGFDAVAQIGEDASFNMRKAGGIMIVAIVMGAGIYIAIAVSAICVLPDGFDDWPAYIASLGSLEGLQALPVFNAVNQTMGAAGLVVLNIATFGAIFSGVVGFTLATSRLVYAMARENIMPHWFMRLHPKYGTPSNALIAILLASLTLILLGRSVLGWILDMSSVGAAIAFLYTSLATMRQAKAEGKIAWSIAGLIGAVFSAAFIAVLLIPIPIINSTLDMSSYVLLVAWIVLGVNFYTPTYQANVTSINDMPNDFDDPLGILR